MRETANARDVSGVQVALHPETVRSIRQKRAKADWMENMARQSGSAQDAAMYRRHRDVVNAEIDALHAQIERQRLRMLALRGWLKPGLAFIMNELDGARA